MPLARALRPLALLLAAGPWRARAARTQALEASGGEVLAASSAEVENPIFVGAHLAADRARRERERRERERRERERRERERLERERRAAHIRANKQDCIFEEQWQPWGECSADCGGGIQTSVLASRIILQRQDTFGYGSKCPAECSDSSKVGCGQEKHQPCAVEMCPSDCSKVDLGNRLPGPGVPVEWSWSGNGKECVFQYWQVLGGSDGPKVRLLAETQPQVSNGSDPSAYEPLADSNPDKTFVVHAERGSVAHTDVAIGWRGCASDESSTDPELQRLPLISVCMYGSEGFQDVKSNRRELSRNEQAALRELRRESRVKWANQLVKFAGRVGGIGPQDAGVELIPAVDSWDFHKPRSTLRVTMALSPPLPPQLNTRNYAEVGDDIRLEVHDALSSYHVSVRRVFGWRASHGFCKFIQVPSCDAAGQAPCVDPDLTLRNFPMASTFELELATSNSAGMSRPARMVFRTRGQSGTPLKDCSVDYWSCAESGDSNDVYPEEDDPECSLAAPPLPVCRMEPRKGFTGELKCDGKKYWRECKPFMKHGDESCVSPMQKVCVHTTSHLGKHDHAETCDAPGCSASVFPWSTKTCCCESATDPEPDSPRCACTSTSCQAMGLAEASDPKLSCMH
ncbi:unnamed protein product [Prorocentrum cordatum]|uniref:Spondin-1 n=1 Tax=Prorocentrum cordatum TaxID=2364126 RepID=A0ABN9YIJ7_9DINO|nr:unnamed protein product [Polarella glacialis]